MAARRDPELRWIINAADLAVPDGVGVVYASWLTAPPIRARVAGYDLIRAALRKGAASGLSVYLLGGKPGVAERAARRIERKYPGARVLGSADGYFDRKREKAIINDIREKRPDMLLVGLGMGKQEKWIGKHRSRLAAGVAIGCGGTLDVLAGGTRRAPSAFRRLGLEWLYRLVKEPSRIRRQLCLPKFALLAVFRGCEVRGALSLERILREPSKLRPHENASNQANFRAARIRRRR
jgi:N-acetylglucosaminyldiphosphoundecaprenol N-acetyl-beta-D-mannosaminyltransferase